MALTRQEFRFILKAYKQGIDFNQVAMLGRQRLLLTPKEIKQDMALYDIPIFDNKISEICETGYAEDFFKFLGAKTIDSFDNSDYESATQICDLGSPIDEKYYEKYSFVFDGGTIEHIFNVPVAIRNAMNLVAPNGCLLSVSPCNNWMGHGFYQFSPELYFSIFNKKNAFTLNDIILYDSTKKTPQPYRVIDCFDYFVNTRPMLLNVFTQKKESKIIKELQIMQSVYQEEIWDRSYNVSNAKKIRGIKKFIPILIKNMIKDFRSGFPLFYEHPLNPSKYEKISPLSPFKNPFISKK